STDSNDAESLLTSEEEEQFDAIKDKVDYDKTWNQNLEIIREAVAPFEVGHTLPNFEETLNTLGIEIRLPYQFRGKYATDEGEEEVRPAPEDETEYKLVDNADIHEEFVLDEDGRRKIVYSPDRVEPIEYTLQPNDEKVGIPYSDGRQRIRTKT
ncbi:1602_t:CDS:1, partial [Funneliformis geosporum]